MAHFQAFDVVRPSEFNRCDFALVSMCGDEPTGFLQCMEMDADTIYLQSGGAFSPTKKSVFILPSFLALVDWCRTNYRRLVMRVSNENRAMLQLALKGGFLIIGTSNFKGKVTLEMELGGMECP